MWDRTPPAPSLTAHTAQCDQSWLTLWSSTPKYPNQIGVLDAFKDFQLVCSFLDGFMVVGLKPNLEKETGTN